MDKFESNMELVDSAAPVVDPAPSPEVPAEEKEVTADPAPENPEAKDEPVLYETPDGRKVDAVTLQKEWKENFLPEFTRKSQELADLKRGKDPISTPDNEPEWKKPDYVPKDYAEVIELAKREAINEIQSSAKAEEQRIAAVQAEVDTQLSEIKTADPKLNEDALFTHANKYGFRDLKVAYANMKDMQKVVVDTEARTVKNLKTREADPISTTPGGEITEDNGYDPRSMSQFDSANAYYAYLRGKK
jgi:hypothetical protein